MTQEEKQTEIINLQKDIEFWEAKYIDYMAHGKEKAGKNSKKIIKQKQNQLGLLKLITTT